MPQLQLFSSGNTDERWTVRVSRRARRLSVRVYPGGRVEVVVPPGASPTTVQRFVGTHRRWIDERVEVLSARAVPQEERPTIINLAAVGRRYTVEYEASAANTVHVSLAGEGWLRVSGAVHNTRAVAHALRRWLMELAQQELAPFLQRLAAESSLRFARMQVRRQRTRWGSCSAAGTISLNVCTLFLEPAVARYLLVHELSHTQHMNHSRRFWALVESLEPEYRRLDRELLRGWQRVPSWMFD